MIASNAGFLLFGAAVAYGFVGVPPLSALPPCRMVQIELLVGLNLYTCEGSCPIVPPNVQSTCKWYIYDTDTGSEATCACMVEDVVHPWIRDCQAQIVNPSEGNPKTADSMFCAKVYCSLDCDEDPVSPYWLPCCLCQ